MLARASIAAALVAVSAVLALHALRFDLEPASHRLSEYVVGPWGWLMTSAFVAVAAALSTLRRALPPTAASRPFRLLLTVAAIGFVASALFPTDPSRPDEVRETAHTLASTGALMALTTAALWSVTIGARTVGWRRAHATAAVATAVAIACVLVSPLVHDSSWTGAVQRLCYASLTVWLLLLCRTVVHGEQVSAPALSPRSSASPAPMMDQAARDRH